MLVASAAISYYFSGGTRYRFELDRELSKHPINFSEGMPTGVIGTGEFADKPLFDFNTPRNLLPEYIKKYFAHEYTVECYHIPLTQDQQNILNWRNLPPFGGGYNEQVATWGTTGCAIAANEIRKRRRRK
jgi:hypothetical protein